MIVLAIIFGDELLGSERGNLEALRSIHNSGVKVHLAYSGLTLDGGQLGKEARRIGIETHILPGGSQLHLPWMLKDPYYLPRQIYRLIANSIVLRGLVHQTRADVIILNGVLSFMFILPYVITSNKPLIYRMGDSPVWNSIFQMFLWRDLIRTSSSVVCISQFIQNEVKRGAPKHLSKTRIIYNQPISRIGGADETLIRELSSRKRELQLVYVGQITQQKGVFALIRSLIDVNDARIGAWIVGGSQHTTSEQNKLKELVDASDTLTSIEMLGYIEDPRPYYHAADWHIAPSIYQEPLGNTVQEAKTIGTPSIVSNSGGLSELVENGKDGIVIDNINEESLRIAITELLTIKDKWRDMGEEAKKSIDKMNSENRFASKWIEVLTDVLKK
jgi:glycosyltransferase involved in cell wall biosynthesis